MGKTEQHTIKSFDPQPRILMGAGPSSVHERVRHAMSRPTIGHLDPQFEVMVEEMKQQLRLLFGTKNEATFPLSAPGSAGMEMCFVSLIQPGDKVIVCRNGVFGRRMEDMAERCGATVVRVDDDWGATVTPEKVEAALRDNPETRVLAVVHAETSTGVRSDMEAICGIAADYECLTIVDAVTSLAGIPVCMDDWGVDAIFAAAQKCLSGPAGLAPVSFNERAVAAMRSRPNKVQSWFLDLDMMLGYWGADGGRTYHHTPPINNLYGLHEALVMINEEGVENVWRRHEQNSQLLDQGLDLLGLEPLVKGAARLPQITTIKVPGEVDATAVRSFLLHERNIEISAGLGDLAGKVWRVGIMGNSSNADYIQALLSALKLALATDRQVA